MSLKVLFVDMNAYFASVEQQYRPELRGRPVAVVPLRAETTFCIAASYEAKAFGVKTGTAVFEARRMCPGIVFVEARHELYVHVHLAILGAVDSCVPIHRVLSIDEMACHLSSTDRSADRATQKGLQIKEAIRQRAGDFLRCSIGIAPNAFLAKVAGDMKKPDGLTLIDSHDLPYKLYPLALSDFPGIGRRMLPRFLRRGITTVQQLCALSSDDLERIWGGIVGRNFWLALHGHDVPEPPTRRRTVGHSHVLPPKLRTELGAQGVLMRLLCKAAARLRRLGYWAGRLDVHVSFRHGGGWHRWTHLNQCQDTSSMDAFLSLWARRRLVGQPFKVGLTLSDLMSNRSATQPLFAEQQRRVALSHVMDRINGRYGRDAVHMATIHEFLDTAPTRIAFSNVPDIHDAMNWDRDDGDPWRTAPVWTPPPPARYEPEAEEGNGSDVSVEI
ncbi:MAG: DNA polymerase [Planctomycetota bacterium]|nr:MAG: DNA polymerase [Planctomycetota bacterium]